MRPIPASVWLQLFVRGIQSQAEVNKKNKTGVNFFRKKPGIDDDGRQNTDYIGYIQIDDLNETYNIFKEKYPEELL